MASNAPQRVLMGFTDIVGIPLSLREATVIWGLVGFFGGWVLGVGTLATLVGGIHSPATFFVAAAVANWVMAVGLFKTGLLSLSTTEDSDAE